MTPILLLVGVGTLLFIGLFVGIRVQETRLRRRERAIARARRDNYLRASSYDNRSMV